MNATARLFIALGAILAAAAVALGAAASHALAARLVNTQAWFQIAMQYHQFHALGLVAVGLVAAQRPSRWIAAAGWLCQGQPNFPQGGKSNFPTRLRLSFVVE